MCSGRCIPLVLLLCSPALAVDHDWINTSGGFFNTTTNWDPVAVPGPSDRAIFGLNGAYTVSFLFGRTNSRMTLLRDNVTFDLNGLDYTLTNTASTSFIVGATHPLGGNGRLTIDGTGSLTAHAGQIGVDNGFGLGGAGSVTVSNGGALRFNSALAVGSSRAGNLILNSGGDLFTVNTTIAQAAAGSATVNGSGSTWAATSFIVVGGSAAGALSITGAGSITQSGAGAQCVIADLSTSTGALSIDGFGSRWVNFNSDAFLGNDGDATVNISNGGILGASGGNTYVARSATSTSQVTIGGSAAGIDASLSTSSIYIGGSPTFGAGGVATVTINAGGRLQTASAGITQISGNGRINLLGGTLQTGSLDSAASRFNWTGGTLHLTNATPFFLSPTSVLGPNPVVGTGMTFRLNNLVLTGTGGAANPARLTASGGGDVISNNVVVAANFLGDSIVTIDGADSTWTVNDLMVGSFGNATVTISNGGRMTCNSLSTAGVEIGATTLSTSRVTVTGPGSVWEATSIPTGQGFIRVGAIGSGRLDILDGGAVIENFSNGFIGVEAGAIGEAFVDGAGSTWDMDYNLIVGSAGNGSLSITNGGAVLADAALVGFAIPGRGWLSVSGGGAHLDTGTFNVAHAGHATVTIGPGGAINATRTIVTEDAFANGLVWINGGALNAGTTTTLNNAARVRYSAGAARLGNLQMNGGAQIDLDAGRDKTLETTSLAIDSAGGSMIDLADNFMIVDYAGASPLAGVKVLVASAYNGGNWTGGGIGSSMANASSHSIGYVEATDIFSAFPATFAGRTIDDTAVLLAFTRYGDANLDLIVNIADFSQLAANFNTPSVWSRGDFNYSGMADIGDFALLAGNFNQSLPAGFGRAAPEPGTFGFSLGCAVVLSRLRRRAAG